jgi:hypothetical protein
VAEPLKVVDAAKHVAVDPLDTVALALGAGDANPGGAMGLDVVVMDLKLAQLPLPADQKMSSVSLR